MAIFAGVGECGRNAAGPITGGAGLITVLTLVTAVILAISGRHPQRIFDLVMGLNRWCYRVLAYVARMRDEHGRPGSTPAAPTQAPSPRSQPTARAAAGPRTRPLVTNMCRHVDGGR